jgi:hypothetical protein
MLMVWLKHRRALQAGGLGFFSFWRECRRELKGTLKVMDPRGYRWAAGRIPYTRTTLYERIPG